MRHVFTWGDFSEFGRESKDALSNFKNQKNEEECRLRHKHIPKQSFVLCSHQWKVLEKQNKSAKELCQLDKTEGIAWF